MAGAWVVSPACTPKTIGASRMGLSAPCGMPSPTTSHPRLWVTAADLPRLQSWAVPSNPIYAQGLTTMATRIKSDMDSGKMPFAGSACTDSSGTLTAESYAEIMAFMSLISSDQATKDDYAQRARTLLFCVIDRAKLGLDTVDPVRVVTFSSSNRSRWSGEAFGLVVDWIYPYLSTADKADIRTTFLRWSEEQLHATITTSNHPEPVGVVNDPVLVSNPTLVRWSANNFYTTHARNLGLMAMALDAADDADNKLHAYLDNVTGAWLYVIDSLLRHDAAGGIGPEGTEYGPQSMGYAAQLLFAMHTAGVDTVPQATFINPFWGDALSAAFHMSSPKSIPSTYPGTYHLPESINDLQTYAPGVPVDQDAIGLYGMLGLNAASTGDSVTLNSVRWLEANLPAGGAAKMGTRSSSVYAALSGVLYFLLFDPTAPAATDPRASLPTDMFSPGLKILNARTGWDENAAWFHYQMSWNSIDHQHADANNFGLYRKGEWITKERSGYGSVYVQSSEHNTVAIYNTMPIYHVDYRKALWETGSQWPYEGVSDGKLLASVVTPTYAYALGDATDRYNSNYENIHDVQRAVRSIVWLKPDVVVTYDETRTGTPGSFKRVWVQTPSTATVSGSNAIANTSGGQQLFLSALLPPQAVITVDPETTKSAAGEPMNSRVRIEPPTQTASVNFLTVLQGADGGATQTIPALIQSTSGIPFVGAIVGGTAILFPSDTSVPFTTTTFALPSGASHVLMTGLVPNASYSMAAQTSGTCTTQITVGPGSQAKADNAGVLYW